MNKFFTRRSFQLLFAAALSSAALVSPQNAVAHTNAAILGMDKFEDWSVFQSSFDMANYKNVLINLEGKTLTCTVFRREAQCLLALKSGAEVAWTYDVKKADWHFGFQLQFGEAPILRFKADDTSMKVSDVAQLIDAIVMQSNDRYAKVVEFRKENDLREKMYVETWAQK